MKFYFSGTLFILAVLLFSGCKDDEQNPPPHEQPFLIFKFKFDSTQIRLNNFGQPTAVPAGHGALSPHFNSISAHYIELAQDSLTLLGNGKVLYRAPETNAGGSLAIDFNQSRVVNEGQTFFSIPISDLTPGTYRWLRVSLAYQNYDVPLRSNGFDFTGTLASFIGFNTYITSFTPKSVVVPVNGNRSQGYWAFEMNIFGTDTVFQGQAPGTTVPNPINLTSPIPAGSCVVTGAFNGPLLISGNETKDIVVTVSLSNNNSFEWTDANGNNIYEPPSDTVVDMGIRGLIPYVTY
ncbi:MAG TPA: hypothetical protein PLU53_09885 [Bacteroidia bacterium]|nr:hypothetical protein [Bacteroidia bacterium]